MSKIKTLPWDVAEHLETDEDMAAYLEAALEERDPALVATSLRDIARAKRMSQIARETGLGRESLYKALSPEGNPEFATVLKVVQGLGPGCAPPRHTPRLCAVGPHQTLKAGCAMPSRPTVLNFRFRR
jgi:probable addiction module antidote protein